LKRKKKKIQIKRTRKWRSHVVVLVGMKPGKIAKWRISPKGGRDLRRLAARGEGARAMPP